MGNSDSKTSSPTCNTRRVRKSKSNYFGLSEFSLVNFASNLSSLSLSFRSGGTQRSTYSATRPWSRVSRHKWRQSTLDNPLEACKTAWPVPRIESAFLPEFKIKKKNEINFEFVEVIAKGAFGRVYKVRKIDSNEFYAMKVLSKAQVIAEDAVQQVKDEVRIQSMCGHNPFIVNCPYYWQTRKKIYIVSHYVSGGELLTLCQQYGPLPEDLAAIYIAEIALALDFLHNSGVIFRDLKLENVLLDDLGHVQLIDFGLAKWLSYNGRTRTICGTLQYMAPEILSLESSNGYGHAVDWWSLGVLACVLLTSKFPPVILRRMAEIAAEVHVDSTRNINERKPVKHDKIIDSIKETKNECSNFETKELSASNELVCTQFHDNSLLSDINTIEYKDETDHFRITNINEADNNFNYDLDDDVRKSKTNDNLVNEEANNPNSNMSYKDDINNKKLFENTNIVDPGAKLLGNSAKEILKVYTENEVMFSYDVECSDGARDLIQRLLNADPQKRLRSLLSLQNIRFFKDVNFADIRMKKIAPVNLLRKYFPDGPIINKYPNQVQIDGFADFDSVFM